LPETPQADSAPARNGSRTSAASASPAPLTRAELRRRAQAETLAPVLTRRQMRQQGVPGPEVIAIPDDADVLPAVAVESLPDLAPEALEFPDLPDEVPVVVETATAAVVTSPIALATETPDAADERPHDDDPSVDAFEAAARLFSFTGETPVQVAAAALADDDAAPEAAAADDEAPRRGLSFKKVATASFSLGVLGAVGLLTVGMTVPIEAVAAAKGTTAVASRTAAAMTLAGDAVQETGEIQAYVAPTDVTSTGVQRSDEWASMSIADLAAESGITNSSNLFTNDPTSAIQWPFPVGVPITYGFGMRSGRLHEGLDFVPGAGAPIQAVADGTVRIATESGGAYGVTIVIDHVIDGERVSTRYAHMQYGSLQVEQGQQVEVGQFIGRVGDTGRSFGAHMHFEVLAGGTTAIDPMPWLREHAGG
jgi:murein DD-endopeptidase MepM/ murein hydrolase activator NlpD